MIKKPDQLFLTSDQAKSFAAAQNGICTTCHTWANGKAAPNLSDAVCPQCRNRTLQGVDTAKARGFLKVIELPVDMKSSGEEPVAPAAEPEKKKKKSL